MENNIYEAIKQLFKLSGTYNPFGIAELLNYDVRFVDMSKKPLGHCSKILKETVIILDDSLQDNNLKFFVCAHELFHAINHQEFASYYTISSNTKNKMEYEANKFAMELVKKMFAEENGYSPKSYKDLAIYGVSEEMLVYL